MITPKDRDYSRSIIMSTCSKSGQIPCYLWYKIWSQRVRGVVTKPTLDWEFWLLIPTFYHLLAVIYHYIVTAPRAGPSFIFLFLALARYHEHYIDFKVERVVDLCVCSIKYLGGCLNTTLRR